MAMEIVEEARPVGLLEKPHRSEKPWSMPTIVEAKRHLAPVSSIRGR
jgi:hypothetical protein